jgi:hypothetical protein
VVLYKPSILTIAQDHHVLATIGSKNWSKYGRSLLAEKERFNRRANPHNCVIYELATANRTVSSLHLAVFFTVSILICRCFVPDCLLDCCRIKPFALRLNLGRTLLISTVIRDEYSFFSLLSISNKDFLPIIA